MKSTISHNLTVMLIYYTTPVSKPSLASSPNCM